MWSGNNSHKIRIQVQMSPFYHQGIIFQNSIVKVANKIRI